jgi:hypothetical protein
MKEKIKYEGIHADDPLFNHNETAERLRIARQTLYNMRHSRKGPDYVLIGRKPMYRKSAIEAYIRQNTIALNPSAID